MTGARILVIKLGALGDFVLATGPFAAIRQHHADAEITLLTTPPFAAMARQTGFFDHVWDFGRPQKARLRGYLKLYTHLRKARFDRVYDLQTSDRSSFYRHFTGKAEWSGIARGCSHPHRNPDRDSMHTLDRQAEQLRDAGIMSTPPPDLDWAAADIGRYHLPAKYALLVPGGSAHRPAKRWPAANYGRLAQALWEQGILPVVLGAGAEQALADQIEEVCPDAVSFVDRTDFTDIICLARDARLAIGNDTGPMHLAAAAGCPSLVLFSAESAPALCAPRGQNVTILQQNDLANLSIDIVFAQLNL